MQPEERDTAYLWDMLQAAEEVRDMVADRDLAAFLENRMLVRAVERGVEIIGEAARRVSADFAGAHPEVPWRTLIGQRNILAHEYGHIDHELLYRTVMDDVPELIVQLQSLLPPLEPT